MIYTGVLGFLVIIVTIFYGKRPLGGDGMPSVGSNSLGISAACHPPEGGNDAEQPLMWGAVGENILDENARDYEEDREVIGHCSFSSAPVDIPIKGRLYQ